MTVAEMTARGWDKDTRERWLDPVRVADAETAYAVSHSPN